MHIKDRQRPSGKDAACKNIYERHGLCSHPALPLFSFRVCTMAIAFSLSPSSRLRQPWLSLRLWLQGAMLALMAGSALAQGAGNAPAAPPTPERQQALVRMVRQDCGSCHGLHLTGGLGPALTPEALADKPLDSMVATIYGGRPGTPMAPWKAMLSEADALWIAQQLFAGFPAPAKEPRP